MLLLALPAILLDGPKGVGKTSTALQRAQQVWRLDDPAQRAVAEADPAVVTSGEPPILVDEWQRVPATWDAVRRAVDADPTPGRLMLTGSAASPATTHTGAARIVSLRMCPLTTSPTPWNHSSSLDGTSARGRTMPELTSVCVFASSSLGADRRFVDVAASLAQHLAGEGIRVVYGGGGVGLMGVLAETAVAAGGEVVGVMPETLKAREMPNVDGTELHTVGSMHERKQLMYELSDGFIALPGGIGTLEELAEVTTWAQLGLHAKPIGVLNAFGYFDPLLAFLDGAVDVGFVRPQNRALILSEAAPERLLERMRAFEAPPTERWIEEPEET
ncbi:MAG: TIGR00730 family Rossman fold protein [Nitriliruptorales bacterium]